MSTNDITGASLFVGGYSKQGEANFDNIFRKNKEQKSASADIHVESREELEELLNTKLVKGD